MGSLRFRRSVSICKGVRLNFGKKGVSISSGIPGFRKTYNFNTGKTTTSVGIPGTGIYYVDTSGPSKKKEEKKSGGFFSDLFDGPCFICFFIQCQVDDTHTALADLI